MGAYSDRIVADGASNYWRLGEPSGTSAIDVVGGANGTISGGVTLNQPGALSDGNTAMSFNGTTGYIGTTTTIPIPVAATMESWIKTSMASGIIAVCSARTGGSTGEAPLLALQAGTPALYTGPGVTGTRAVADGQWHYLVAVLTGTTVSFYVDGVLDVTQPFVRTVPSVGRVTMGTDDGLFWWPGALDEIAIYPRALTAAEIAAHYALATAGTSNSFPFAYRIQPGGAAVDSFNVWEPITPSNTVDLPRGVSGGIWVGGGGDVAAVMGNNVMPIVFAAVPSGAWLPIAAKRINATATTATGLLALYEV